MASADGTTRRQQSLDAILALADEIARLAPDCAERAMQITRLVRDLDAAPDAAAVTDTIAAETADSDLSETQVRATARSVVDALRKDPL
jgi:hypothetical protein